ncbi:MAG: enoyl-CoA hydratase/isomerase family protein [bacterium]|nr:enoyl-CoA hydratase/isomerase family protein [bacterium]
MNSSEVTVTLREHVAEITISRPPTNLISLALAHRLNEELVRLALNKELKIIVLRGAGGVFSSGINVEDLTRERVGEMMHELDKLFENLNVPDIITLAAVNGEALGTGCEIALFCDLCVASARSSFGQPEVELALFPPVATALLPRLGGRNRALQLLLTGDPVDAQTAKEMGIINEVFPSNEFEERMRVFLRRIARHSHVALSHIKRVVDGGLYEPVTRAVKMSEDIFLNDLMSTSDAQEGIKAALENRPPKWFRG